MILFLLTLVLLTASAENDKIDYKKYLSDEFIDYINSAQGLWIAGRNFPVNTPEEYFKKLPGVVKQNASSDIKPHLQWHNIEESENLPETFDAREKWPMCESLKEIRDQGDCAAGWALAPVSIMTDRVCIRSGGKTNFHFSAIDLITCCEDMCFDTYCTGGDVYSSWNFIDTAGVVSGGNYNSTYKGCKPYPYQTCYHDEDPRNTHVDNNIKEIINCSDVITPFVKCSDTCDTEDISYEDDKRSAEKVYLLSEDENQIRKDIYINGPVQAVFVVYSDFLSYKSGVYKHVAGEKLGDHAVKILGWGVENGTKYWLVANSWNVYFGEKGFFKILRGENHCGIEGDIITALPYIF